MGLDFNALDLPINLKLWHDAGLRVILSDPETVRAAQARTSSPKAGESAHVPHRAPVKKTPERAPRPTRAQPAAAGSARPQRPAPVQVQAPSPARPALHSSSVQAAWPPELRDYFSRIRIPAFSLWTYWEFPVDLSPAPDRGRQALLKNMLKALHWPQGSSVFWPLSKLVNGSLVPDLELFAYGVQAISPVYVFCFGHRAGSLLLPHQDITACRRFSSPHTTAPIQILPGLDEMLPDNKRTKSQAWKILRSYAPMPM